MRNIKKYGFKFLPDMTSKRILYEVPAISFAQVRQVLETLEYASVERVMFEMMFYTGCRGQELNNMFFDMIDTSDDNPIVYWKCKKQGKPRRAKIPKAFYEELLVYRDNYRHYANRLFGVSYQTFRRYFYACRKKLPYCWQEKGLSFAHGCRLEAHVLQLKGLRKLYQTRTFKKNLELWNFNGDLALQLTSKEMQHSSTGMTAYHYIRHFDEIGNEFDLHNQKTLLAYL